MPLTSHFYFTSTIGFAQGRRDHNEVNLIQEQPQQMIKEFSNLQVYVFLIYTNVTSFFKRHTQYTIIMDCNINNQGNFYNDLSLNVTRYHSQNKN